MNKPFWFIDHGHRKNAFDGIIKLLGTLDGPQIQGAARHKLARTIQTGMGNGDSEHGMQRVYFLIYRQTADGKIGIWHFAVCRRGFHEMRSVSVESVLY
jgi:hypothetical protein